jgi:hypothetical protein
MVEILCILYENGKLRLVESIPKRGIKGNDGGSESNYDILQELL